MMARQRPAAKKKAPAKKAPQRKRSRTVKRDVFLAAYAKCGNITAAARIAGCSRSQHYEWMADPAYAEAFSLAHEEAVELLEMEARRRAMEGVLEPVIYQGALSYETKVTPSGKVKYTDTPLTIRKYSDVLLIFLLKGAKPDKYRDNFKGEITVPGLKSKVDLSKLTDEQLQQLETLVAAAAPESGGSGGGTREAGAA